MRMFVGAMALAALAGVASADIHMGDAKLLQSWNLSDGSSFGGRVVDPSARYSNVTNFGGQAGINGGAAGGITRLNADDIHMTGTVTAITKITFSTANLNSVAVSARPRLRFYAKDGAGGGPGTLLGGFTFNPLSLPANGANLWFFNPAAFNLPQNFWAGMTFDNVGTTTTDAQLNNLGQLIFNPVDVGSSQDVFFQTNAAGSHFNNSPAGAQFSFGGSPLANFGWEFVPAPASLALLGLGGLAAGRRRR